MRVISKKTNSAKKKGMEVRWVIEGGAQFCCAIYTVKRINKDFICIVGTPNIAQ